MRKTALVMVAAIVGFGCEFTDPTQSDEYQRLENENDILIASNSRQGERIVELQDEAEALGVEVAALNGDVETLGANVRARDDEIAFLNQGLDTLRDDITALRNDLAAAEERAALVGGLNAEVAGLHADIARLNQQIEDAEQEIRDREAQIEALLTIVTLVDQDVLMQPGDYQTWPIPTPTRTVVRVYIRSLSFFPTGVFWTGMLLNSVERTKLLNQELIRTEVGSYAQNVTEIEYDLIMDAGPTRYLYIYNATAASAEFSVLVERRG